MKKRKLISLMVCLTLVLSALIFPSIAAENTLNISDVQIVDISVGYTHTLAIDSDGHVWSWGSNVNGQLGIGYASTARDQEFHLIPDLQNIEKVFAGPTSYAIDKDGEVWSWGVSTYYQIGTGDTTSRYSPTKIPLLQNIHSIASGGNHVLALTNDGDVYAWGYNISGETGLNNNVSYVRYPTKVDALWGVTQVAVTASSSFALLENGAVMAWGSNRNGEMGNGRTSSVLRPTQIDGLDDIVKISTGIAVPLFLKNDGTLWRTAGTSSKRPELWPMFDDLIDVSNGQGVFGYVLTEDGTVKDWSYGATVFSDAVYMQAKYQHAIAVQSDGSIWGWGNNINGQLRPYEVYTSYDEPVLLFGPGTYVGPGVDPIDPPDTVDTVDLTNMVQSTDYSDLSDWYVAPEIGTMEASGDTLTLTIDSPEDMYYITVRQDLQMDTSHIYYVRASMYFDQSTFPGANYYYTVLNLGNNQLLNVRYTSGWSTVSAIGSPSHNGTNRFQQLFRISPTGNHEGGHVQSREPMVIDLTEAFGAGNEPSVSWCDANIPFFSGTTTISV